jgi:hypothetical protein
MICPIIKINGLKSFLPFILAGFFSTFLALPYQLSGQEKNEEVTIIAPYNPTVTTAQKINRNPKIILQENAALPPVQYNIHSIRHNTIVAPENPKPSRVPGEPSKDLYRSHIKAGFGNYLTPYLELWVNSLQSDELSVGAHIRHLSSLGKIKDYANSTFSNTLLEAYGEKFINGNILGASLNYSRNMVHRYGYKPDEFPGLDIPDDDIKQLYQKIGFDLGFNSNNADDNALNYYVMFDGYYLFDKYESNETAIFVNTGVSKKMDLFGNNRGQELGLDLRLDYYMNKDSLNTHNSGIFSATPFFDMDLKPYRIYIGLRTDYRIDSISSFHLYPVIKAEAGLLEEMLVVYAGIDGGLTKTSFDGLSSENPFINSVLPREFTNNKFEVYGGIKGRITEIIDFNIGLRHATVENLPLFVSDTNSTIENTFGVIYDDAGIFRASGELGFRSKSDFGIILRAGFYSYSMKNEEKAWQKPNMDASIEAYYTIKEKLTLSTTIIARGGMYARTFDNNNQLVAEQMNGWLDLSLGGEYRINQQFSAFIKLNNLLNNSYFKWYNYPVQKFNVLAGVGFSF